MHISSVSGLSSAVLRCNCPAAINIMPINAYILHVSSLA